MFGTPVRRVSLAILAIVLLALPLAAQIDPDAYVVNDAGNGRYKVTAPNGEVFELDMVSEANIQREASVVSIQVKDPNSPQGGFFRYTEAERKIEVGGNGQQLVVQIKEDGMVMVGDKACDGRTDQPCIAKALGESLDGIPVESIIAMRAALKDVMTSEKITFGNEIREMFRSLAGEIYRRKELRTGGKVR